MAYTLPDKTAHNWYEEFQGVFNEIDADIQAAGTGTAKVRIGTRAERLAYGTPYDGLLWIEEDYNEAYKYEATGAAWKRVGGEISDFILTLLDDADAAAAQTTLDVYSQAEVDAKDAAVAASVTPSVGSRVINGGAIIAQRPAASAANSYGFGPVDRWEVKADYTTVSAGNLVQSTLGALRSGKSLAATGVTASGGNQKMLFRHRIAAEDCKDLASEDIALMARVYHDVGSAINVSVEAYSADAENDFSAVTLIGSLVAATSVPSATATDLEGTVAANANAGNGLEIIITFDVGADVTTKNFAVTDATLVKGGNPQDYIPNRGVEQESCEAYYQPFGAGIIGGVSDQTAGYIIVGAPTRTRMGDTPSAVVLDTSPSFYQLRIPRTGSGSTITAYNHLSPDGFTVELDGFASAGINNGYPLESAQTADMLALDAEF